MGETYNRRLFSSGLRKYFHEARFFWLKQQVSKFAPDASSVMELGCFDAKSIGYLPSLPDRYLGLDANVEGGLTLAKERWKEFDNYRFIECKQPADIDLSGQVYDISICMETLEHLSDDALDGYLNLLMNVTNTYVFITVPNETGLFFLFKHVLKRVVCSRSKSYKPSELVWATLGKTQKIQRRGHKGFNYRDLRRTLAKYFDILSVTGIPFRYLPASINFTIGFVATTRRNE